MSLVGIRRDATITFESKFDPARGTEEATQFTLGTLTARVQVYLRDQATKFKPDPENEANVIAEFLPNASSYETVRFGLRGWERFRDEDGNDLPFSTVKKQVGGVEYEVVSEDTMDALPIDVIREIAEKLNEVNALTEVEAKNSEG
jgi:hypothetical protein